MQGISVGRSLCKNNTRWKELVTNHVKQVVPDVEWKVLAADRERWRMFVSETLESLLRTITNSNDGPYTLNSN